MKLQRQLSNGNWINDDRMEYFLELALEHEQQVNKSYKTGITTIDEAQSYLQVGKTLSYDWDWYANIRDGETVECLRQTAISKHDADPNYSNEGWVLECGCTVYHRSHIMQASLGTSCSDCYDRMSN